MRRKPLSALFSEFVRDEFIKSGDTYREFAKKTGLSTTLLQKLIGPSPKPVNAATIDIILTGLNTSLVEVVNRYGEYEEE